MFSVSLQFRQTAAKWSNTVKSKTVYCIFKINKQCGKTVQFQSITFLLQTIVFIFNKRSNSLPLKESKVQLILVAFHAAAH